MYMSASDVIYIPDPRKDFVARDKETVIALVSLENSFVTTANILIMLIRCQKRIRSKTRI